VKIYETRVKTALSPSRIPGLNYALNPYIGCLHGCLYCYAVDYTKGPPAASWGSVVYVKKNLVEVLKREAVKKPRGAVGVSTITDPYQPPEAKYKITRSAVETLGQLGYRISIQTKSALVIRDVDLFKKYNVDVGITITTLKDKARILEPLAAHPLARAKALEKLAEAGVERWIFYGPVVPGFNDKPSDIEEVVALAYSIDATVYFDKYRPKPRAHMRLSKLYRVEASETWWREVAKAAGEICKKYGARCISLPDGHIYP
jgi:DNA repair photolyase